MLPPGAAGRQRPEQATDERDGQVPVSAWESVREVAPRELLEIEPLLGLEPLGLRHIGWHVLRHTFATELVRRGAPLVAVKELLGHSNIQMTMRYAHVSDESLRSAVNLLSTSVHGQSAGNAPAAMPHPSASPTPVLLLDSPLNQNENRALAL